MDNRKERIQPAVRKETEHVMVYTAAGVAVMWCVFLALHLVIPEKVPFAETEEAAAKRWIQASYSQRNMMQMLWVILTIVLPCFQFVAGILPLLIPGTAIKLVGAVKGK